MTLTKDVFVERAKNIHGDKYNYSHFEYINWDTKSSICCPIHGQFFQKPRQHIERKSGCPTCGKIRQPITKSVKYDVFLKTAKGVHGDKYDYTNCGYINLKSPITIKCRIHGPFVFKHAYAHTINKNGCPKCGRESTRLTTQEFIEKSIDIHGDYYSYTNTTYVTGNEKVWIACPKHGNQYITPTDHYRIGCWLCKRNRMQDVWLDEIGLPNTKKHRQVKIKVNNILHIVDGYELSTNTIYLFHGDYWHGNPHLYASHDINLRTMKTFGKLFQETVEYEERLRKAGYVIISMWEHAWLQQKRNQNHT